MCADTRDFFRQDTTRNCDRPARKHDRAGRERAEAIRAGRGVAVADRDAIRRDAQFVRRDLRQRRLVPLPVVLDADMKDE